MRDTLENLFYQTRSRFWEIDLETYCEAMSELNRLASLTGFNKNEIIRNLIIRD